MKVAGIIAEYNPFHNGHAYHIEEVRKKTGAEYVIAIMSGNFVQRGAPAIVDKYSRAEMALLGGADLVIELPTVAAVSSAELFARTGVSILNATGIVSYLGFGCETAHTEWLEKLAILFSEEPEDYQKALNQGMKEGLTFPAARAKAARQYFERIDSDAGNEKEIEEILNNPNNILAIEYLKAIRQTGAQIHPCPILRKGSGYHDATLDIGMESGLVSATAIRNTLKTVDKARMDVTSLQLVMPKACCNVLEKSRQAGVNVEEDQCSALLRYKLFLERGFYTKYAGIKEELANRIQNEREQYSTFTDFCARLKTKNITYTNISRALTSILLDLTWADVENLKTAGYAPYIRVLGFRKTAAPLLTALKDAAVPVITKVAEGEKKLGEAEKALLEIDLRSGNIYNSLVGDILQNEYRRPLIYV